MESFNLDQAIFNYVGLIKAQGSLMGSDADELTGHLYDSTETLHKMGLSEQEAFMVACKRIGNVELLAEEYGKVNMSLKHNKIWAYLLVGFNIFYGIPAIAFALIALFYWMVFRYFETSTLAVLIIITFHILFIAGIFSLLKYKHHISCFIENKLDKRLLSWVAMSSLPTVISMLGAPYVYKMIPGHSIKYLVQMFENSLVEFSFYLAAMSIPIAVLSLIFSMNRAGEFRFKSLFDKPSVLFLLLFGFIVELLAASTRAMHVNNMILQAVLFGIFYFVASFLLAYYNRTSGVTQSIFIFTSIGFILESSVGIMADIDRGNSFYTVFFVTSLLANVSIGGVLGAKLASKAKHMEHL
ncbi:hypothetical protein [Pedobacter psychrodurus]|uniref:hypothetical protein n=1 Tax=Pedobacter psychrodurus TaxID=2530456 RepID=UPI00292F58D8|nr:hypothetical protein [Pedobacter psychrodurus]